MCAQAFELAFYVSNIALDIVQDLLHRLGGARATLKRSPRQPQQSHKKKSRQPPQDASRVRRMCFWLQM